MRRLPNVERSGRDCIGRFYVRAIHGFARAQNYSLAGVLRGSRAGLRSGPSLPRFRPGGAGVTRAFSRSRGDGRLRLDRFAIVRAYAQERTRERGFRGPSRRPYRAQSGCDREVPECILPMQSDPLVPLSASSFGFAVFQLAISAREWETSSSGAK
jgi:hypothetical protein